MASAFGAATASAAASVTENAHKSSTCHSFLRSKSNKVSFRLSPRSSLHFSSKTGWNCSAMIKAQLNKVAVGSPKAAASTASKSELLSVEAKDVKLSNDSPPTVLATEESISEFITQVSSLLKLVDSKDIVELHLKQLDCEILIRKKEALPPPPTPAITYVQSQPQPSLLPPVSAPSPAPTSAPSPALSPPPSPPKAQPPKSAHPPLKCPMAGTFYRSPGPGEPAFVKVGDKVQKGQVLCIIEAMKLMNEIESDRSGTIVEIVAEDGKPVSVDTPLFVIEP
ncbi:hypothetical protein ABFS83_06G202600 [Erythranthe nasuta]